MVLGSAAKATKYKRYYGLLQLSLFRNLLTA